jgi:hypothetical protein
VRHYPANEGRFQRRRPYRANLALGSSFDGLLTGAKTPTHRPAI